MTKQFSTFYTIPSVQTGRALFIRRSHSVSYLHFLFGCLASSGSVYFITTPFTVLVSAVSLPDRPKLGFSLSAAAFPVSSFLSPSLPQSYSLMSASPNLKDDQCKKCESRHQIFFKVLLILVQRCRFACGSFLTN